MSIFVFATKKNTLLSCQRRSHAYFQPRYKKNFFTSFAIVFFSPISNFITEKNFLLASLYSFPVLLYKKFFYIYFRFRYEKNFFASFAIDIFMPILVFAISKTFSLESSKSSFHFPIFARDVFMSILVFATSKTFSLESSKSSLYLFIFAGDVSTPVFVFTIRKYCSPGLPGCAKKPKRNLKN